MNKKRGNTKFNFDECKNDIFVCTRKELCHSLFCCFLFDNKLHNKNIRIENNLVTQFNIKSITIQENPTYREVESTIEKLNVTASPKYLYHGQSIHRLAQKYYGINYNKDYTSQMTPQVFK
jgi:hypothetical protein